VGTRGAGIRLTIDPSLPEPPYDQLKTQITGQVDSGTLIPGEKLPTVRALATDLGLAPNTVARAYRELEQLGVVATRGRAGTFVSGDHVRRAACEAAATYADSIRSLGVSIDEALDLVRAQLARRS